MRDPRATMQFSDYLTNLEGVREVLELVRHSLQSDQIQETEKLLRVGEPRAAMEWLMSCLALNNARVPPETEKIMAFYLRRMDF